MQTSTYPKFGLSFSYAGQHLAQIWPFLFLCRPALIPNLALPFPMQTSTYPKYGLSFSYADQHLSQIWPFLFLCRPALIPNLAFPFPMQTSTYPKFGLFFSYSDQHLAQIPSAVTSLVYLQKFGFSQDLSLQF